MHQPPQAGEHLSPALQAAHDQEIADDRGTPIESVTRTVADGKHTSAETPSTSTSSAALPPSPAGQAKVFFVQVWEADGSPAAGVPIQMLRTSQHVPTFPAARGSTDQRGRASFSMGFLNEHNFGPSSYTIAADVPHEDPIRSPLAEPPQAGATYELTLPPLGAVVIEVVGADGQRFREGPVRVATRWIPAGQVGRKSYGGYERCPDAERVTEQGLTRYDHVGFGVVLTPSVSYRGFRSHSVSDVPGPTRPGEVVHIQVPLGPAVPFLRARLFDLTGEPLPNQQVTGEVAGWDEVRRRWHTEMQVRETTDAAGWFAFPMTGRLVASEPRRLAVRVPQARPRATPYADFSWSRAVLPLPNTIAALPTDDPLHLGDLHLQTAPLWVAGQITDPAGHPLRQVRVDVSVPAPPHRSWPWDYTTRATTDEQGRFAIQEFDPPETVRLTWTHSDFEGEPIELTSIGEPNLQVTLRSKKAAAKNQKTSASLAVEFECGTSLDPHFVMLTLQPEARESKTTVPLYYLGTGETVLPTLPPGKLTLRVSLVGFEKEGLVIDDLALRAGETLRDPRLLPLDLRGLGRSAEWKLLLPGGQPLREGKVRVRTPGAPEHWKASTDLDGRLRLFLPQWVDRVEISAGADQWTSAVVGIDQVVRFPAVR